MGAVTVPVMAGHAVCEPGYVTIYQGGGKYAARVTLTYAEAAAILAAAPDEPSAEIMDARVAAVMASEAVLTTADAPPAPEADDDQPMDADTRQAFWAQAKAAGLTKASYRQLLADTFGVDTSEALRASDAEKLAAALAAPL